MILVSEILLFGISKKNDQRNHGDRSFIASLLLGSH
jgi:hypothetical protein